MGLSLAEIRKKLQDQDSKRGGGGDRAPDTLSFPFWNIEVDQTATIRFLPDGNPDNGFFWREKHTIRIPFAGIKGGDDRPVNVTVPCMRTYGKPDPILEETKSWWKDPAMEAQARLYYPKKSFIYQGFVVQSPMNEENLQPNPIRRMILNPQLHDKVKACLMDPEIDVLPVDFNDGLDFRLTKSRKGQYNNYDNSSWARKSRPLSDVELAAIDEFGLFDLSTWLPEEPTSEQQQEIFEMFESSLNGDAFDAERFKSYRPFGNYSAKQAEGETKSESAPAPAKTVPAAPAAKPVAQQAAPVAAPATEAPARRGSADVLELLKRKNLEKNKTA